MTFTLLARLLAAATLLCLAPSVLAAQAFVSLGGPGGSVSQFRAVGGAAIRSFSAPSGAVDMLLSADGSQLYVGTTTQPYADVKGGAPSLVAVLDPLSGAVLQQFAMPGSVVKMVLNGAGDHIFATGVEAVTGTTLLMSLDLLTGQAAAVPAPGSNPFSIRTIAISPDGGSVYVPVSNQIDVFNAHTLAMTATIALPSNGITAPPAVTFDGSMLLAAGDASVYALDLASRTLVKTIRIPASAAAFGSVLSPDGKTFYVNNGTLSAVDVASLSVKASMALGQTNPFRLGISPDGTSLFATDLTYGTTAVVDAASLRVRHTLQNIAPPFAVVVKPNGNPLLLNENSNRVAQVDTDALAAIGSFPVGDEPGAGVFAAGKLFVPEVANVVVQETPAAPTLAKVISTRFIQTDTAVSLAGKVYAGSGSAVRVIDPALERTTSTLLIQAGGSGIGSAISLAASGDGHSLLASFAVFGIDSGPVESGIIKVEVATRQQKRISSFPFVPGLVASDRSGLNAYAISFINSNQVGRWDTANDVFSQSAVIAGNPVYVGLGVSGDGSTLILVDQHGKVDFVQAATLQVFASIPVGSKPSGIAVSADGSQALVTDSQSNSVTVLDLVNRSVLGTVNLGAPSAGAVFLN